MRQLVLITVLALSACGSPSPFAALQSSPKNSAWWLRLNLEPNTNNLRGIPAEQLHGGWCKFTEYQKELFLVADEIRQYLLVTPNQFTRFSVAGPTTNVGATEFVVGAYATCGGSTGTAVALLTKPDAGEPQELLAVRSIATPAQWATLSSSGDDLIEVWWCLECDAVSTLKWDGSVIQLEHNTEMGE